MRSTLRAVPATVPDPFFSDIRTTREHPFFVRGKGWIGAGSLETGDVLVGHDGQEAIVEAVTDTGDIEKLYNVGVAEYHTYFVGGEEWGFSVWCIMRKRSALVIQAGESTAALHITMR